MPLALEIGLDDVRAAEHLRCERCPRHVLTDGRGLGGREEALRFQLPRERQEGLALRDQRVRRRQHGESARSGRLEQRAVARPRQPLKRIVAKEEVDASAAERHASPVDPDVIRSTRVD